MQLYHVSSATAAGKERRLRRSVPAGRTLGHGGHGPRRLSRIGAAARRCGWGSSDPASLLAKLHDAVHGDDEP
jgi:hypothetical protein